MIIKKRINKLKNYEDTNKQFKNRFRKSKIEFTNLVKT